MILTRAIATVVGLNTSAAEQNSYILTAPTRRGLGTQKSCSTELSTFFERAFFE